MNKCHVHPLNGARIWTHTLSKKSRLDQGLGWWLREIVYSANII